MLKEAGFFFHTHMFKRNIIPPLDVQGYGFSPAFYRKVFDPLGMTPVQGVGNP